MARYSDIGQVVAGFFCIAISSHLDAKSLVKNGFPM